MINIDSLGFQSCQNDIDCGIGRFCDSNKICSLECTTSKDCNYKYNSSGNEYECSPCGRCIPKGIKDNRCIITSDISCLADKECMDHYNSDEFSCYKGFCTMRCVDDNSCRILGIGFSCNSSDGICYRKCFRDNDCYIHGWQYECNLPNGVDKAENENSPPGEEIYGECVPRAGGIDWGNENGPQFASHKYEGIWAFSINAAMTVSNIPFVNVQNTVLKSLLLVKIVQKNEDIQIFKRWCKLEFENFDDQNKDYEDIAKMILPEQYALNMPVASIYVKNPPPLEKESKFVTDKVHILFGARLKDIYNDPLPDKEHPENQFDDDRDSKPGVTALISGLISGEIYSVQRFWTTLNVNVVDSEHLHGLIDFRNELSFIDAIPSILYYKPIVEKYKNPDRSYFAAQKISPLSSCNDVIEMAKNGWLKYEPFYNPDKRP
ncbi:MAG: hypothetical protein ACPL7I_02260 [Myxococcota bacterium]